MEEENGEEKYKRKNEKKKGEKEGEERRMVRREKKDGKELGGIRDFNLLSLWLAVFKMNE